jgi:hypothetical protein
MKKITLILFLLSGIFSALAQTTCAEPTLLSGPGLYLVDGINGTDVAEPLCSEENGPVGANAKSEWFSYTPSEDFTVTITTDIEENTPRVDTRFHVYTGSCGNLSCFAGDDDGEPGDTNYSSVSTFNVTANTTYLIAFDNKWSASGFTFQLIEAPVEVVPGNPVTFSNMNVSSISSQYNICVVDMNADGMDDIVGVSSTNIRIHTQNENGTFSFADYVTTTAENMPSWSLAAGDYNRDGVNDLMYGGGSGVTFMKSNESGFEQVSFEPYVFCQRTNFIDLNNDGHLDAFSCHDVQPNVYFLNDGTGEFDFYQSNVTPGAISLGIFPSGGNYGSIWIDYDNDGDQDLFIAKCRGGSSGAKFNELHRNNGDGTFSDVSVDSNLRDPLQTWSSAWADFDNDGDMDVVVGASSFADGSHKFMENNGDGTFSDITAGSGWDTNTSTSIEHIAHDFNNDGFVDVMGGGSKIMYNLGDGTFVASSTGFGVAAVGDLNNDGFLDFQTGNTLRLNNGNSNNWIKFNLQGVESNRNGIGARIEIYGAWGKQIRDARSGDGFEYMSSLNVHFGIGEATTIDQVIVRWPSGIVDTFNNPDPNQIMSVVEGSTLSVGDNAFSSFSVYPNPATDLVTIKSSSLVQVVSAELYDMNGKRVYESAVVNETISIQSLADGTYILLAKDSEGTLSTHKLIKQ